MAAGYTESEKEGSSPQSSQPVRPSEMEAHGRDIKQQHQRQEQLMNSEPSGRRDVGYGERKASAGTGSAFQVMRRSLNFILSLIRSKKVT